MAPHKPAAKAKKPVKSKPKAAPPAARRAPAAPVAAAAKPASPTAAPAPGGARPAAPARPPRSAAPDIARSDASLFDPLTAGEIADALRTLTEDRRLSTMAKVGRYRVICTEPLVVKPPHWMSGHRLVRAVVYDYAADRTVDACVDLDAGVVAHLELSKSQPMLSRDEEALAVSVAMADDRVRGKLTIGDGPQTTLHYWGRTSDDLAYARRAAAVVFGRADGHATVVAIVDLLENVVSQVVPAELW